MCTAVTYKTTDHYFGRNLDIEKSYGEKVVITPRNFILPMRCFPPLKTHYALIGMAAVISDYPLYFEATNEKGLGMAGLNFPDNAHYYAPAAEKDNVSPFELIPWILGQCDELKAAVDLLNRINLVNINFSENLPLSPLHWMLADSNNCVTIECTKDGLKIYNNPYGILTNNPTFDYHLMNIKNYMHLHEGAAENKLTNNKQFNNYSLGMGAIGLPGDFSSTSRFVRAVFIKEKSKSGNCEKESVHQFFHILSAVAMPKGCVMTAKGEYEYTRYSCCCNTDKGIYYYKTYNNSTITAVELKKTDLDGNKLVSFELEG